MVKTGIGKLLASILELQLVIKQSSIWCMN